MYTNYSKMGKIDPEEQDQKVTSVDEAIDFTNVTIVDAPTVEPELPELQLGFVAGCAKLNVRAEAKSDADVLATLKTDTEVMIDIAESTEDFYKICTASGLEGYCMKTYISVQ
jgi:SH3-like domain-containing protein